MSITAPEPAVLSQPLQVMGSVFRLGSRLAHPRSQPVRYVFVFSSDPDSPLSWSHKLLNNSDLLWPSVASWWA